MQTVIRAVIDGHVAAGDGEDPQRLERGDARSRSRSRFAVRTPARAPSRCIRARARRCTPAARAGRRSRRSLRRSRSRSSAMATSRRPHDALRMREQTGCAAIMIARGSFGQPWIFDQTRASARRHARCRPTPSVAERFAVALDHARDGADVRARSGEARRSSSASTSAGT